jgi:hypothetical protein
MGATTWDAERALGCGMEVVACSPVGIDHASDHHDIWRRRSVAITQTNRLIRCTSGSGRHER